MRIASLTALTTAGLLFAGVSFAGDRVSIYPEGSIFKTETTAKTMTSKPAPQPMTGSSLNPLDQPTAGIAGKSSDRDAGNLAAERSQAYSDGRAEARSVTK
jgi:hypothetical protein